MIDVQCPTCSKGYRVSDDKAGKKLRCRECQAVVSIPAAVDLDLGGYDDFDTDDYGAAPGGDAFDDAFSPQPATRSSHRRRRKPVKKSGGNAGIIIAAVCGGGMILLVLVVGIVFAVKNMGTSSAYKQHEKLSEDVIDQMRELTAALESVTDRNSAKAAALRINRVCDKLEEIINAEKKLPRLTRAENRRLKEKVDNETEKLDREIEGIASRAAKASRAEPTFLAAAKRLIKVSNRLGEMGRSVR